MVTKGELVTAVLIIAATATPLVLQRKLLTSLNRERTNLLTATADLQALRHESAHLAEDRQLAREWRRHEMIRDELETLRNEFHNLAAGMAVNPQLPRHLQPIQAKNVKSRQGVDNAAQ